MEGGDKTGGKGTRGGAVDVWPLPGYRAPLASEMREGDKVYVGPVMLAVRVVEGRGCGL